ncbi:DNA polymerase IV [Motiliproteus sp. MSK22-1]|uniref:DNA polymerase IV n=1 Tax=Motiliproteus sp. MSK22-1 TaxID=1897630 RepID=UPI000976272C|nr:DNA polymerase IV [Motiliproteus sp. MSK22-1]OMH25699.1 DNA polymerase IV [Motiliproteus sp. MSK22-1]
MPDQRKIIHCDCDCFYAAVEMRDNPSYRGIPIAVGGDPGKRGVISTCNYEARQYGVRSAMPSAQAKKLCPKLLIIPGRMEAYRQASGQIHDIFQSYTDLIEPLSLDEAYLDVSSSTACRGSATMIAEEIRQRVKAEVGITISAGVAPNKFIAKIASDWKKPDGLFVVLPDEVESFVEKLPVEKLFGVGPATATKLNRLGVLTCGDLRAFNKIELVEHMGSFGERLYQLSRGIDERPIRTSWRRKSLSIEHTYTQDLASYEACLEKLPSLMEELNRRLSRLDDGYRVTGGVVKVKFDNFVQTTVEHRISEPTKEAYTALLKEGYARANRSVRLLGVGVRLEDKSSDEVFRQLNLFEGY